jgi:hypothetical protein
MIQRRLRRKFAGAESRGCAASSAASVPSTARQRRQMSPVGTTIEMQPGVADPPPGIPPDFTRRQAAVLPRFAVPGLCRAMPCIS